jgi:hypothetical protein
MEHTLDYYRKILKNRINSFCLKEYRVSCDVENMPMIFNLARLGDVKNKLPVFVCWLFGEEYLKWYLNNGGLRYIITTYQHLDKFHTLGIESETLSDFLQKLSANYRQIFELPLDRASVSVTPSTLIKFYLSTLDA